MRHAHWIIVLFVALGIGGLQGCNKGRDEGNRVREEPGLPRGDGNLYLANAGTGSFLAFDQAQTAEGDLSPDRHFPETLAGLIGLFLDKTTDTLYVANTGQNAILIYENASELEPPAGSASATRVISGPQTGLRRPNAVAYDATRQRLYVSNEGNASILVFEPGCSETTLLSGNIAPCNIISGASTLLASPGSLALDPARDILYISNGGTGSILIYENASQFSAQGDLPPTRTISLIAPPAGLFIDSANDRLYAVQRSGEGQAAILIYEDASTQSGPTSADRILTGPNTLLAAPEGIDVDTVLDQIYVINHGHAGSGDSALVIFASPFTACADAFCDLAPARVIFGDQTELPGATGIAIDSQRERIYVANRSDNTVLLFGMEGNIAPTKMNTGSATRLELPISFSYDSEEDRLYVLNSRIISNAPLIAVYDHVSPALEDVGEDPIKNAPPSWTILRNGTFSPRAIYVDKTRNLLLFLLLNPDELRVYDLNTILERLADLPDPPPGNIKNVTLPAPVTTFTTGLNRPLSMSVDEGRGFAYVANDNLNGVAVYDLNTLDPSPRTIVGADTQLIRPFGLFIDSDKDILYAVNTENNNILAFDNASGKQGNTAPDRILTSSASVPLENRLNAPTAPFINAAKDRLFIINRGNNSVYIFDNASTLNGAVQPDRKLVGENTGILFPSSNTQITGALWVDTRRGGERLFLGEPIDPTCTLPPNQCSQGAFLLFSAAGNLSPSQVWSGGENRLVGPSAAAVDPRRDLLYVADPGDPSVTSDDSIILFTQASRSDGNLPLTGTVSVTEGISTVIGTGTAFKTELALGDQIRVGTTTLVVSSISSDTSLNLVSPYPDATASARIALRLPRKLCSPAGTTCASPDTKLNNPAGLAIDYDRNRLYVSNSGTDCTDTTTPCNSLLVFRAAGSFTNNAVPDQVITSTPLNSPRGLALDLEQKILYVANHGGNSVLVFKNVEDLNGSVTPDAEIGGEATEINAPVAVAIDWRRDILYVLNEGSPEILVFEQASALNGNSAPARILSAGDSYQDPSALFLDVVGDLLYVADKGENEVYIFTNASQAEGAVSHETIAGANTGLDQPTALAVDTAR